MQLSAPPELHFEDSGRGFPVVWIHGFPLSGRIFRHQRTIDGVRHVIPDLPGFGHSPIPNGPMSIEDYADAVLQLLDSLGIDRAVFGGISMGGYIVLSILRSAAKRVAGMILLDTREIADTREAREKRFANARRVEADGTLFLVESMLPQMLTAKGLSNPSLRRETEEVMKTASSQGTIAALHAMAGRSDTSDVLRAVTVPALIIVGSEDSITPVEDARRMQSLIDGSEMVEIPEAAHLSNFEQPAAVNEAISAWLLRNAGRIAAVDSPR